MGSSSRAPAPLYTAVHGGQTVASPTTYENTPRSAGSEASDASSFIPMFNRKGSSGSTASNDSTSSTQTYGGGPRKMSTPAVNRYTHCGRHSDQYLFGGWGSLVKGVFNKKN